MKKAAFITGGAKRLGKKIALKLASLEYDIALHYNHSEKEAQETQEEIKVLGVDCKIFKADLSKATAVENLGKNVIDTFPYLNILINNASIFPTSNFLEEGEEMIRKNMQIHFFAPYTLSKIFAKNSSNGLIINILDTNVSKNKTEYFDYLLSKKTLFNLNQQLAIILAPRIRVNAIAPGMILPEEAVSQGEFAQRFKNSPMNRAGNPENVLQALEALVKNDYLNGQIIFVDGGENLA